MCPTEEFLLELVGVSKNDLQGLGKSEYGPTKEPRNFGTRDSPKEMVVDEQTQR